MARMLGNVATAVLLLASLAGGSAAPTPWQTLEPGLDLGRFDGPGGAITILRIDPGRFDLRLLNASAPGEGAIRTAKAWAARAGAVAAINASMYQEDFRTSVGLMRTRDHVNQRRLSRERAVLAFDPLASGDPPIRLIDRACEDGDEAARHYGTLVQSIRMISCDRKNVWAQSDRRFSTAAIGIDGSGRVLFVHARAPVAVHDLVERLLALPIDLRRAMYVEGGPEAQLYVKAGGRELEAVGSFETAPSEADDNHQAWPVPNVVAVVRRPGPHPASAAAAPHGAAAPHRR